MPAGSITLNAAGDSLPVTRAVGTAAQPLPAGATVTDAWLTVQAANGAPDSAAAIFKHITTASQVGVGQITDSGATSHVGQLLFILNGYDTWGLAPSTPYRYAVKVLLSTGDDQTIDSGAFVTGPRWVNVGTLGRLIAASGGGAGTGSAALYAPIGKPMPSWSTGLPAYASSDYSGADPASSAVDTDDHTYWRSSVEPVSTSSPAWLALDISGVANASKATTYFLWYATGAHWRDVWLNITPNNLPQNYTIRAHAAAGGGAPPTDLDAGWVTVKTVTGNSYDCAAYIVNLSGYNWVEFRCTAALGAAGNNDCGIQVILSDASRGTDEAFLVIGDSITDTGWFWDPRAQSTAGSGWALPIHRQVAQQRPGRLPAVMDAGVGGWATLDWLTIQSGDTDTPLNMTLPLFPGRFVAVCLGTNDANAGGTYVTNFAAHLQTIVNACLAAGKTVILPTIPGSQTTTVQTNGPTLNAAIAALWNGTTILKGPDLWAFFNANPTLIGPDNLHPADPAGWNAYYTLWVNWMLSNLY